MPDAPSKAQTFMVDAENGDRKNARVADKILLALPKELDAEQRAELVRGYANEVTQGKAPWLAAFHDQGKDAHNPHAHLLIRDRDPETGKRVAGLSEKGSTDRLRSLWESHANRALERAGRPERIDRRTLQAQGIEREPTVHEGPRAQQMERRGAKPQSRVRQIRNRPNSRLPHRQVDYRNIDQGRSRPAYNRHVRETPDDYWKAIDADNQARELQQLRDIHHRRPSVVAFPVRPVGHGIGNQDRVDTGVPFSPLARSRGLELPQSQRLLPIPPVGKAEVDPAERVARTAPPEPVLKPRQRPVEQPAKSIEQNIKHEPSIRNKNLSDKGKPMSVDDEEKRRLTNDLADAKAREAKSEAARDNALKKGYMRPDLAGPSIDRFYKNNGADALNDKFKQFAGPSEFGVKKGNPLTSKGRDERAAANEARRDLPKLVDTNARDRKNREASERAYENRYGRPEGQGAPSPQPSPSPQAKQAPQPSGQPWQGPRHENPVPQPAGQAVPQPAPFMARPPQGPQPQQPVGQPWQGPRRDTPAQQPAGQTAPQPFMARPPQEQNPQGRPPKGRPAQGQPMPPRKPRGGREDDD